MRPLDVSLDALARAFDLGLDDLAFTNYQQVGVDNISVYAHTSAMTDPKTIAQTCIMQALRSTARQITQRYEEALRPEDLTASQFTVLAALSVQSGVKVTTLAERVGMDRTTLNRVLAPLQRRGMVRLDASRKDARAKAVHLEPMGKATFERAVPLWERAQNNTQTRIEAKALADLRTSLEALRD